MEFVKNAISWVEIPALDFDRAKAFYEKIFDFEMPLWPAGDVKMGVLLYKQEEGGIGGAICQGPGYKPAGADGAKVYLSGGSDLNTVLSRVAGAGGTVIKPKTLITPEIGYDALFLDTEGNHIYLHSAA
jgi:hypothetical protein